MKQQTVNRNERLPSGRLTLPGNGEDGAQLRPTPGPRHGPKRPLDKYAAEGQFGLHNKALQVIGNDMMIILDVVADIRGEQFTQLLDELAGALIAMVLLFKEKRFPQLFKIFWINSTVIS
ncbi:MULTISPECIES: hypothetical protein [unclassified Rhizobium]|uniref:hypothetical protein n=1 Tax=unclassified Rhizobium TaxID=2613769 RepID=UPI000EAAA4D1|nr:MULTISPECIES: hypothetical protein [unclassified Rhizobium]AYG68660.1 hypothetical protein CCGE531_21340 [Rhizobium sp. CCGE531]AYG75044.1 hypothetical protein CCGE532_20825 [Rhizobium sp. CCGE532]